MATDDEISRIRAAGSARRGRIKAGLQAMLLTKEERDILGGFMRVFEARQTRRRVSGLLFRERLDDEFERLGRNLGPTPETRRKLRVDVLLKLKAKGHLDGPEVLAAEEIRDVWAALERALFPSRNLESAYGRVRGGRRIAAAIEKLSPEMYRKWRRYRLWASALKPEELQITLGVVKDNVGVWQMASELGLERAGRRKGSGSRTVLAIVQASLRRYAMTAGYRMVM